MQRYKIIGNNQRKNIKKYEIVQIYILFQYIQSPSQSKNGRYPKTSTAFSAFSDNFYIVVRIAVFLFN